MEIFVLLYFFVIFFFSCLIAGFIYVKFSKYPFRLMIAYIVLISIGLGLIGIKYWQLTQLNSITVPFTPTTGNSLIFSFTPNNNGDYSIDLTFLNNDINQKYEICGFPWNKSTEKECKNALIFRRISGKINNQNFSSSDQYQKSKLGDLEYGYGNHNIIGPSLNIFKFHGKANSPVQIHIKIDAEISEIQTTKPAIVVGVEEESFMSLFRILISYTIIAIPFLFSILFLFFSILLKNKR